MKVKEMLEVLQKLPPEMEIVASINERQECICHCCMMIARGFLQIEELVYDCSLDNENNEIFYEQQIGYVIIGERC